MKKRTFLYLCLWGAILGLSSCKKDLAPNAPSQRNRTVIEYMVADNNLYSYAERDINEMEAGWSDRFDGYMVVFLYPVSAESSYAPQREDYDEDPRLLLISRDERTNVISSRVLKRYDRSLDPTDPEVMNRVIADAMTLAPAENYALIFWSHGSGWLPRGMGQPLKSAVPTAWDGSKLTGPMVENPGIAYSFGQSNSYDNSEMEIDALAGALPKETVFDFILFDACHMACIEVAWELKDRTKYLIASAAETLADGFPYEAILAPMFETEADVTAIGKAFFDYYNEQSGAWQSATVGVVRSDRLTEVAAAMRALCEAGISADGISYAAQQYGRRAMGFENTFYDLTNFVQQTWGASDPAGVARFEAAMEEAVAYQAATPWLFDQLRVLTHCGLSCYLPRSSTPLSLEAYRTRFGWSEASGMGQLLP